MTPALTPHAPPDPVAHVLQRLEKVQRSGSGWVARCPAHEDRRASLSIGAGDDGRALLHCHAGCSTEAVASTIGLALSDLFPPDSSHSPSFVGGTGGTGGTPRQKPGKRTGSRSPRAVPPRAGASGTGGTLAPIPPDAPATDFGVRELGKPVARWAYHDAEGRPLFHVCRYATEDGGKTVRAWCFDAGRWHCRHAPAPRPLYNLHELAARAAAPVVVCEGEKAADAAASLLPGFVATTAPGGAKAADKAGWQPLAGRAVVVWPDHDEPGAGYAADVRRLALEAGAASVVVLEPAGFARGAELAKGWDAADAQAEGWTAAEVAAEVERQRADAEEEAEPWPFRVDARGVWHLGHDKDGRPKSPRRLCGPLHVLARTRDPEGRGWGALLEWRDKDGRLHSWAMPAELLAGDGAEYRRAFLSRGLDVAPQKSAQQLLTHYLLTAPTEARALSTERGGWFRGCFVLPDGAIGAGEDRVLLQTLGEPLPLRTAGTLEEWRENVAALAAGNSRLLFALSLAFAAPLLEPLGEDSGGVNLVGSSSSGKTTALLAAASVWGGPEYVQRWRATTNGLEAVAVQHNDAPLFLDELAQVDARAAGEVAYMLANGSGKARAQRTGDARPVARWRTLFLSAGEIGLSDHMRSAGQRTHAGQEVRLADVPADAGAGLGAWEELHGYASGAAFSDAVKLAARTWYGAAARAFLAHLVELVQRDRAALVGRVEALRRDFAVEMLPANAEGQARRVAARFALVAAGGELATSAGLTGWCVGDALAGARTCFRAWLERRGGAGAQEDRTALEQVARFFELHGESRFSDRDAKPHDEGRSTNERTGFRRRTVDGGAEYWVLGQAFRSEVCQGHDWRSVARLLVERGWVVPGADGNAVQKIRLPGFPHPVRCYHFVRVGDDED